MKRLLLAASLLAGCTFLFGEPRNQGNPDMQVPGDGGGDAGGDGGGGDMPCELRSMLKLPSALRASFVGRLSLQSIGGLFAAAWAGGDGNIHGTTFDTNGGTTSRSLGPCNTCAGLELARSKITEDVLLAYVESVPQAHIKVRRMSRDFTNGTDIVDVTPCANVVASSLQIGRDSTGFVVGGDCPTAASFNGASYGSEMPDLSASPGWQDIAAAGIHDVRFETNALGTTFAAWTGTDSAVYLEPIFPSTFTTLGTGVRFDISAHQLPFAFDVGGAATAQALVALSLPNSQLLLALGSATGMSAVTHPSGSADIQVSSAASLAVAMGPTNGIVVYIDSNQVPQLISVSATGAVSAPLRIGNAGDTDTQAVYDPNVNQFAVMFVRDEGGGQISGYFRNVTCR